MNEKGGNVESACLDSAARDFVLWALQALGWDVRPVGKGARYEAAIPERDRPDWDDRETLTFQLDRPSGPVDGSEPLWVTADSKLFHWLVTKLASHAEPFHAAPCHEPVGVHELVPHIFEPYRVDEGNLHLGGCTFEERPVWRQTWLLGNRDGADELSVCHLFYHDDGTSLEQAWCEWLELDKLRPLPGPPRRTPTGPPEPFNPDGLTWKPPGGDRLPLDKLLATTVIWCKYAEGKLVFVMKDKPAAELPFGDWARLLVDRRTKPPPFRCPHTGLTSYHLTCTDDGRVTVAEAIGVCEETGQRVLAGELNQCAVTGRRVLAERLVKCPASDEWVLPSTLVPCAMCRQEVSPLAIRQNVCSVCRNLGPARRNEPPWPDVFARYPALAQWTPWRQGASADVYVCVATKLTRKLLLVLRRDDLQLLYTATALRFGGKWVELTREQRMRWLGERSESPRSSGLRTRPDQQSADNDDQPQNGNSDP